MLSPKFKTRKGIGRWKTDGNSEQSRQGCSEKAQPDRKESMRMGQGFPEAGSAREVEKRQEKPQVEEEKSSGRS
jgi:hypothetical protein